MSKSFISKNTCIPDLIVVAYYTLGTPYEQEAMKLLASLKKHNINYDIVGIPNLGTWQANTRQKAKFMSDMLEKHSGYRLLYVDSDAILHSQPVLFKNYSVDVAVRFQDFRWKKNECLSGTIYMENNERTKSLCKQWMAINVSQGLNASNLEQWNLGKCIEDMNKTHKLTFKNLPPEYTFIFDIMRRIYPNAKPVIEHFQASRKLKRKL